MAIKEPTASDGRRLESLAVRNLDSILGPWTSTLLHSRHTLSCLTIGFEKLALVGYSGTRVPTHPISSGAELLASLNARTSKSATSRDPILRLEHFKMINLKPINLLNDHSPRLICFSSLTSLTLESCHDLVSLFSYFVDLRTNVQEPDNLKNLRALTIRYEQSTNDFRSFLQSFLCYLQPLRTLRILLEGTAVFQDLRPILDIHGRTLRCLLWDEREGRRMSIAKARDIHADGIGYLERISELCPFLVELGVSIRWSPENNTDERYDNYMSNMRKHQKKVSTLQASLTRIPFVDGSLRLAPLCQN